MHKYSLKELAEIDDDVFASYSPFTKRLLRTRGIKTDKEAEIFLNPDWERDTHDPFLMKDMKKAVSRITDAIQKDEQIAIWSDYDMDGIPGAVILYDTLNTVGYEKVLHYTPHRNIDGFGLNKEGITELVKKRIKLIITVDCGTVDVEQVAYANKNGIDVVVTDHHIPGDRLPKACAILNPKQKDCEYPDKTLCGASVAFKLAQALLKYFKDEKIGAVELPSAGWEKWLLDMAGVASISDMVPLVGESRVIAYYGLIVLKKSRRVGLQALLKKARADQRYLTEDDVAFTIAPRINAASRMGHASDAFKLLATKNLEDAGVFANELDNINNKRKTAVAVMKREIKRRIEKLGEPKSVIVLGNPEWKPSLLGLVASGIAEDYSRPVFLWGREESKIIKGSCRSDGVCNVHSLMSEVSESFMEFGGHSFAGGYSLEEEQVHTLEKVLVEAHKKVSKKDNVTMRFYDDVLTLDKVSWETYKELEKFAPFGEGNPKPIFLFRDVALSAIRTFGKGKEHIELSFEKENGGVVKAISFFTKIDSFGKEISEGDTISIIANFEASHFMGRTELRLRLIDII